MSRLTVVVSSPRVPAGLLSWPAWKALHEATVATAPDNPLIGVLVPAEVSLLELDPEDPAAAGQLLALAADSDVVWVAGPGGDEDFLRRIGELLTASAEPGVDLELLPGSWDSPGARMLDVVAVMDRLRSPGGCPWDAEQTHASLATYLVEETYEVLDAIETGDDTSLREELGDVLLQVVFHARLASERDGGWSIDDVAAGLVDKLIRRHPHVFGGVAANTADEVNANWEQIKASERGTQSGVDHVPLGQPALRLAAAVQRKGLRIGVPAAPVDELASVDSQDAVAQALWDVVARAAALGVDPEATLRARARRHRDEVMRAESRRGDSAE